LPSPTSSATRRLGRGFASRRRVASPAARATADRAENARVLGVVSSGFRPVFLALSHVSPWRALRRNLSRAGLPIPSSTPGCSSYSKPKANLPKVQRPKSLLRNASQKRDELHEVPLFREGEEKWRFQHRAAAARPGWSSRWARAAIEQTPAISTRNDARRPRLREGGLRLGERFDPG
jgi:hypothetical protein